MHSVVWVWPDYKCHARNTQGEVPEVDDRARVASWRQFLGHNSPVVAQNILETNSTVVQYL